MSGSGEVPEHTNSLASWWRDLQRDVPYALRALQRTPGFTILCVLTIAVGIGANAAIFSVINAVLLRPLPYAQPERLVRVWESLKDNPGWTGSVSIPNLVDWQQQSKTVQHFVAYQYTDRILDGVTEPERILGLEASANLFAALGARAIVGRTFAADEDKDGHNRVVVLSENYWRRRYAADTAIVGQTISLNGVAHTVIGVMPRSFSFPVNYTTNDIWLPLTPTPASFAARGNHLLNVVAQLKPNVTLASAAAEMKEIAARLETQYPDNQANRTVLMVPLQESVVGHVKPALYVLLGSVALVLLIACANVANLLLARAATRRRDVAVRLAMGARRGQLVRQYLTESTLLALGGALLGSAGAFVALKPLTVLAASTLPVGEHISLDWRVFAFLMLVSLLCGVLFGLAPALQTRGTELRDDLTGAGGKSTSTVRHQRARSSLVVAQMALSLMLLVGASLMMRAFLALRATDSGFDSRGLFSVRLSIPKQLSDSVLAQQIYRPVLAEVRSLPGVQGAGMINMLPIDNYGTNGDFWVDGKPTPDPGKAPLTELRQVTPGYFKAMGIAIKAGRDFTEADAAGGGNPILVNEAMARMHFPGENAIGRAIRRDSGDASRFTIVGIVGDVRSGGLDRAATPETYFPYNNTQQSYGSLILVVRTGTSIESMIVPVRKAVQRAAPNVPVFAVRTLDEVVGNSLASRRLNLTLLAIFAGIALVLAASGLYGVISYLVAQRTREIGIRMALGADRARVVRMVMRQGLELALFGIVIGMAGALALTRLLASLLFGVGTRDPLTFGGVPLLICAVAILATLVPAWRASRVNPMFAIRSD